MYTPKVEEKKIEVRTYLPREIVKKMDRDVGKLGGSRSEVARSIIEDYYAGRLVDASQLLEKIRPK